MNNNPEQPIQKSQVVERNPQTSEITSTTEAFNRNVDAKVDALTAAVKELNDSLRTLWSQWDNRP